MSFRTDIQALYRAHGPNHILPFIGRGYAKPDEKEFRAAVVGINSYIDAPDWSEGAMSDWSASWWANAGEGKGAPETHRFHNMAFTELSELAERLAQESRFFDGRTFDKNPASKSGLYATNAVKVYTTAAYKQADAVTPEILWGYAPTWHRELDAMAEHGVFPHLIVILGECVWEPAWRSFYSAEANSFPAYEHLEVVAYETTGDVQSPSHHHVNRVEIETRHGRQAVLLVRLHHPSAHPKVKKNASWLLAQTDFGKLILM